MIDKQRFEWFRNYCIGDPLMSELFGELERYKGAISRLSQWTYAYPLVPFPEPDFKKAAEILKANNMTLDSITASNMRHVLSGVKDIIRGLEG